MLYFNNWRKLWSLTLQEKKPAYLITVLDNKSISRKKKKKSFASKTNNADENQLITSHIQQSLRRA